MADLNPYNRRGSYNQQSPTRDVYSYEYLSRPFELSQDELPQLNTNETQTKNPGIGGYLKPNDITDKKGGLSGFNNGLEKVGGDSGGYGTAALAVTASLNASNPNNKYQKKSEKQTDDLGNSAASAIGPWWGALAQAGEYTSKTAKGDGTNQWNLAIGNADDPFNAFKADYGPGGSGTRTARSILTGGMSRVFTSHAGAKQERDRLAEQKLVNESNVRVAGDQANAIASYKTPKYQALPYGKKGMKIKTKLSK